MKVALVNPPRFDGDSVVREERCEVRERYSVLEPYSLLQLAAILRESGHSVRMLDANGFDATPDEKDTVSDVAGIPLTVDPLSQPYADGAIIDFVDGPEGTGFLVKNPTLGGGCACGGAG